MQILILDLYNRISDEEDAVVLDVSNGQFQEIIFSLTVLNDLTFMDY